MKSCLPVCCTGGPSLQKIVSFVLDYQITRVRLPHPRTPLFLLEVFLIKYCLRTYSRDFFLCWICLQLFSFCNSKLSGANLIVSFVCHPFSQLKNLNYRLLKNLPSYSEKGNLYFLKKWRKITAWKSSSLGGYQSKWQE